MIAASDSLQRTLMTAQAGASRCRAFAFFSAAEPAVPRIGGRLRRFLRRGIAHARPPPRASWGRVQARGHAPSLVGVHGAESPWQAECRTGHPTGCAVIQSIACPPPCIATSPLRPENGITGGGVGASGFMFRCRNVRASGGRKKIGRRGKPRRMKHGGGQ